jgi:hypothetical protein
MDTERVTKKKKIRIICTRTGTKFSQWWEDNLKYMIDQYSNIEYDEFVCIRDNRFEDDYGTFNNLIMFDQFRDKDWINLQFDLDVIIKGDCNKFLKDELHVCDGRQWQSDISYELTGISSDILSWSGDYSHIYQKVVDDVDYYYLKYRSGIDTYLAKEHNPKRFTEGYTSIRTLTDFNKHDVVIFNGHYETMLKRGWWHEYTMNPKPWWNDIDK